jgi:hypothetical protein
MVAGTCTNVFTDSLTVAARLDSSTAVKLFRGSCRLGGFVFPIELRRRIAYRAFLDIVRDIRLNSMIRLLRGSARAIAQLNHLYTDALRSKLLALRRAWHIDIEPAALDLCAGVGYYVFARITPGAPDLEPCANGRMSGSAATT